MSIEKITGSVISTVSQSAAKQNKIGELVSVLNAVKDKKAADTFVKPVQPPAFDLVQQIKAMDKKTMNRVLKSMEDTMDYIHLANTKKNYPEAFPDAVYRVMARRAHEKLGNINDFLANITKLFKK